jgi:hypothetical protein
MRKHSTAMEMKPRHRRALAFPGVMLITAGTPSLLAGSSGLLPRSIKGASKQHFFADYQSDHSVGQGIDSNVACDEERGLH